ncbi:MAG TPA: hypothetical protein PK055_03480 [Gammaproteobacteria bacterium]|nr:hypothetical protein [Gammaproteobacteria bacterium]
MTNNEQINNSLLTVLIKKIVPMFFVIIFLYEFITMKEYSIEVNGLFYLFIVFAIFTYFIKIVHIADRVFLKSEHILVINGNDRTDVMFKEIEKVEQDRGFIIILKTISSDTLPREISFIPKFSDIFSIKKKINSKLNKL